MYRLYSIIVIIIIMFLVSCNDDADSKSNELVNSGIVMIEAQRNPDSYTYEEAVENGDVVNLHGRITNIEKLYEFIENVKQLVPDSIRITQYTVEGDAIITELDYDGQIINYIEDNTRDNFGSPIIQKGTFQGINVTEDIKNGKVYYEVYVYNEVTEVMVFRYSNDDNNLSNF